MKYLKLFEEIFTNNILYHFTTPNNAENILKENVLRGYEILNPDEYSDIHTIKVNSFTRYYTHPFMAKIGKNIKFVLDKNKLNVKYKIIPFMGAKNKKSSQAEERIYNDISDINKYTMILAISINILFQ